ncbi:peptide-methionine (R)-S-oxide reductase MsrB [Vibrio sp. Sgm 5]|uniref:peptide-methionine (R)-S-oxide reductase MsrB n=1 Tax=Vibrio sp. Sgm 5 TaxID=2994387 RepID=UPI002248FDEE|nr:peptide-methionine (R)-S-oxide reductase MsrB [Vibrio sp. Sgm 5]MCX2793001.1 peptide-methionine (R)-S-oxide reductase MsrB [Vibrio sp. Sgm 5]
MLNWQDVIYLAKNGNLEPDNIVRKTDHEWKLQLTNEEFRVTRKEGTERPFSSGSCHLFEPGIYSCVCCGNILFDARMKFDSGTGWPSFTQPIRKNAISYHLDNKHGMCRIEAKCSDCEAHLGHVFPDGPQPSNLRYCMNSVALKLKT